MTPGPRARLGHRARGIVGCRGFVKLRQAEVGQLGVAALRDQDVLGLDVTVQDAGLVRRGEAIGDAGQQLDGLAPAAASRRVSTP